ncbi:MAG: hypothetical protein ABL949_03370 [Fimbriimonadaceae bacterium]
MKNRVRFLFLTHCALVAIAPAQWTATVLHPAGTSDSEARGAYFEDSPGLFGQAGFVRVGGRKHAALWKGTANSWQDIHPAGFPNLESEVLTSIYMGAIAGRLGNHAYVWPFLNSAGQDLNPLGVMESAIHTFDGFMQGGYIRMPDGYHAALWRGSRESCVDLHPYGSGFQHSIVKSMSFGGTQVGNVYNITPDGVRMHACQWLNSAFTWTDLNPPGASDSFISQLGKVGGAVFNGVTHAGMWNFANSFTDLHPPGAESSKCSARAGLIQAGEAVFGGRRHAGFWTNTPESFVDLHAFLPNPLAFSESSAAVIGTDGNFLQIAGHAKEVATGQSRAVMWIRPGPRYFTFDINKATISGTGACIGRVALSEPASETRYFKVQENNGLLSSPTEVKVDLGQVSTSFTMRALPSAVPTAITITVDNQNRLVRSATITLLPLVPTALSFSPNRVTGGQGSTGGF